MKFERIYSPMEKLVKLRFNWKRAAQRYRMRHPGAWEKYKSRIPQYRANRNRRYPTYAQGFSKRVVREMKPYYLARLLRQAGREVTPDALARKRAELQAHRTRKVFRMLYASTAIENHN